MKRSMTVLLLLFIILLLWNDAEHNGDLYLAEKTPDPGIANSDTDIIKALENIEGNRAYLGIEEGRVAIFAGGKENNNLKEITNIEVDNLPPEEQEKLEQGIVFDSEEELLSLLDSYISGINDD